MEVTEKAVSLKKQVKEQEVDDESAGAEVVGIGSKRGKLIVEMAFQKTKLERSRMKLTGQMDNLELLNGHGATQDASIARDCTCLNKKLAKFKPAPNEALAETAAHRNSLRDEAARRFSTRATLSAEVSEKHDEK